MDEFHWVKCFEKFMQFYRQLVALWNFAVVICKEYNRGEKTIKKAE